MTRSTGSAVWGGVAEADRIRVGRGWRQCSAAEACASALNVREPNLGSDLDREGLCFGLLGELVGLGRAPALAGGGFCRGCAMEKTVEKVVAKGCRSDLKHT
jgi:hypothetical protein